MFGVLLPHLSVSCGAEFSLTRVAERGNLTGVWFSGFFWNLGYFIGWSSRSEQKPAARPPCGVTAPSDDRFQLEPQGEASALGLLRNVSFFPRAGTTGFPVELSSSLFGHGFYMPHRPLFFLFPIYSNLSLECAFNCWFSFTFTTAFLLFIHVSSGSRFRKLEPRGAGLTAEEWLTFEFGE